ncbi:unnamed protein product [Hyaloperonospora brassicae]|uniref:OTU domain-containing protein n=1 Tax=Hyaloperonospora brassicae TaxID=162125 RepID=A0AAV0TE56_HYABA|nr:unnamed protein product [Hyaloperonospora brassicae]
MSLTWLRHHVRPRDRHVPRPQRVSHPRLIATAARPRRRAPAALTPAVTYDSSFVADRSVTSRDALWRSAAQLAQQCVRLQWRVVATRKDGNCLFRALSDQLYGHERRHLELRRRLVDFIDLHHARFAPLVADVCDDDVIAYCARLRHAGAAGGHAELVAAAQLLGLTIVVHVGPVKRWRVADAAEAAAAKEGQGKTVNLLLVHDHYSSLYKDEQQPHSHGCSDSCLCRRLVAAPSSDSRASLGTYATERLESAEGRTGSDRCWSADAPLRSSLTGGRPVDGTVEKRGRGAKEAKGAYGRKSVPDADTRRRQCDDDSPVHKKLQTAVVAAGGGGAPHELLLAPELPPDALVERGTSALAPVADVASVMRSGSSAVVNGASSRPKAPAAPGGVSKPEASGNAGRGSSCSSSSSSSQSTLRDAEKTKSPGVVLFEPAALEPMVKPQAALVVLFDPERSSEPGPAPSRLAKKAAMATAVRVVRPTSAKIVQLDGTELETRVGTHKKVAAATQRSVHRPCRAVFEGGRRRRSSACARASVQDVTTGLNNAAPAARTVTVKLPKTAVKAEAAAVKPIAKATPAASAIEPVAAAKPNVPAPRPVEIKRSSKKVFCQGRLVAAG